MMPGGSPEAWKAVQPIVEKVAAQVDDGPCAMYIGNGGAGNFVKMVHNGIEYGDMQVRPDPDLSAAREAGREETTLTGPSSPSRTFPVCHCTVRKLTGHPPFALLVALFSSPYRPSAHL